MKESGRKKFIFVDSFFKAFCQQQNWRFCFMIIFNGRKSTAIANPSLIGWIGVAISLCNSGFREPSCKHIVPSQFSNYGCYVF